MKRFSLRLLSFIALLALVLPATVTQAQDLGAIKTRMAQRLPQLDELKAKGSVGENNRGLVEARGADASAGPVISAENTDREAVYSALAKQTGTSADQVGRSRARQISAGSAAGVWVQKEDGSWHKK
jgi:uncharacterized protein YdbL (DUF1318 family)